MGHGGREARARGAIARKRVCGYTWGVIRKVLVVDDEPMILIPQSTRPEEAWPVRVLLDEIDMPEDGGYQPNTGNQRRYSMKLSVKGVVA